MASRRWMFERGAAALRAALPRLPRIATDPPLGPRDDVYLCPLCWIGFDIGQVHHLTREHVPPKAIGGDVVTLTCLNCNNAASSFLQAHAAGEDHWRRFRNGEDGAMARVTLRDPGARWAVRADVVLNDGAFWTVVDPLRSNPEHQRRFREMLRHQREGAGSVRFDLEGQVPFAPIRAATSRLRDAYLAAFALLGYRYILSQELDDVRRRISEADPALQTIRRADFLGDLRGVFVLEAPLESVMVVANGSAVFLPWPGKGDALSRWLDDWDGSHDELGGVGYAWPTHMPLHLDLMSAPRRLSRPDDAAAAG